MYNIIEDTAQKNDKHEIKHKSFEEMGIFLIRNKLPFGDYILPPRISVDTKNSISEVAMDLSTDHERFRRECERAKDAGCHLYILVETRWQINEKEDLKNWINPRRAGSAKCVTGEWISKTMKTMESRYGVTFMFCHPEASAEMILRILNGEFENEPKDT